jgi:iron complex outermembrane receptor protein
VTPFAPERLTSYELGLKSEWFEQRLRLNAALFTSRYEDLQLGIITVDETGAPFARPLNIGRSRISGVEVELLVQPARALLLSASFGFNRTKFLEVGAAIDCARIANPIPAPEPDANCSLDGFSLGHMPPGLPERTASAAIQYAFRLRNGSSLTPDIAANYQSEFFLDNAGSEIAKVHSRTLIDGRITWQSIDTNWSVALSGTNLADKRYVLVKSDLLSSFGFESAHPGHPREWAISVRRRFGR